MSAADVADRLLAERLQSGIGGTVIGRQVVVLEETTSTNDAVLGLARAGGTQGLVVFAEYQTAGRGQRGNQWQSAAHKGLWFSILLHPKLDFDESPRLTAWAAETIANTIHREFALAPIIKPPNDIHINGKKVAGVLVEMRARRKAEHLAIVGIGININHSASDFSEDLRPLATSLALALGHIVNRQEFATILLRNLDRTYRARFAP